jgi:nitrite reductase/ring-hydroxylating ferredoxin subunit
MPSFVVARVGDVPEGGHIVVEADGRSIGIFRDGLLNRCSHRGGSMWPGQVIGTLLCDRPGYVEEQCPVVATR